MPIEANDTFLYNGEQPKKFFDEKDNLFWKNPKSSARKFLLSRKNEVFWKGEYETFDS